MSVTDIELWKNTATTEQPKWESRAKIIAHFIRSDDIVVDLGAGDRKLKKFIPQSCVYIPVDCTDELPGTFVVDFNKEFRLPDRPFTVIVSAGFMEYMADLESFMRQISESCSGIYFLFTISYSKNLLPGKNGYQKLNAFRDEEEVLRFFRGYTCDLQTVLRFGKQSLFTCSLSKSSHSTRGLPPIDAAVVQPIWRKWRFL